MQQLYGSVGGDLRHLPALCVPGGHPSLFHRRVLHRRHALPGAVRPDGPRVRRHPALGSTGGDGHPGHRGHRPQLVPCEGGARHLGQARAGQGGRARCALLSREHLATSAHHRHLEHRAGHRSAAREVPGVRFEGRRRDGSGRALRRVRGERRVPHRSRLGRGALHHRRDQGLRTGELLHDERADPALRLHTSTTPSWCCARWWTTLCSIW